MEMYGLGCIWRRLHIATLFQFLKLLWEAVGEHDSIYGEKDYNQVREVPGTFA